VEPRSTIGCCPGRAFDLTGSSGHRRTGPRPWRRGVQRRPAGHRPPRRASWPGNHPKSVEAAARPARLARRLCPRYGREHIWPLSAFGGLATWQGGRTGIGGHSGAMRRGTVTTTPTGRSETIASDPHQYSDQARSTERLQQRFWDHKSRLYSTSCRASPVHLAKKFDSDVVAELHCAIVSDNVLERWTAARMSAEVRSNQRHSHLGCLDDGLPRRRPGYCINPAALRRAL